MVEGSEALLSIPGMAKSTNLHPTFLMKRPWQWVAVLLLLATLPLPGQPADSRSPADTLQAEESGGVTLTPKEPKNSAEAERIRGLIGANREKLDATRQRNLALAKQRARLERKLAELRRELEKNDRLRDQLLESTAASGEAAAAGQAENKPVGTKSKTPVPPQ